MRNLLRLPIFIAVILLLQSCTKTESKFNDVPPETLTISASALNVITGNAVTFSVLSSTNNNVTADSKIYVNGILISGNNYSFSTLGNFAVYATKGTLTSNVISVNVTSNILPETITVSASALNVTNGNSVTFSVLSSINNNNVTSQSKIYVNNILINDSSYTFSTLGNFAVYATKGTLTSNVISVNVSPIIVNAGYKHHVLVEEYSGTWCGNCPRILYGVDLLHNQTDKAIVVSTHLFNGDPFITTDGNNLAAQQGVSGVPTGYINRTISWNGPQYQNVTQVVNLIQTSAPLGIAINSTVNNNNILVTINAAYKSTLNGGAKLVVYLVEDKLTHTQSNYSSNLYGGLSSIPNFKYDGVLRKVVSTLSGDVIGSSGNINEKTYSLTIPANIANIGNARLVAFITNIDGTVVNAQDAKVGEDKKLETL